MLKIIYFKNLFSINIFHDQENILATILNPHPDPYFYDRNGFESIIVSIPTDNTDPKHWYIEYVLIPLSSFLGIKRQKRQFSDLKI